MTRRRAIIVGSGAGGSTAAMVLARAGWAVTILEKGANRFSGLGRPRPGTTFSNDELKTNRSFELPDPLTEPRVFRASATDPSPQVGAVQPLPQTVGGGTVHWDAKTPRFWDIDFAKLSLLGPIDGAGVADWPFDYAGLAPFYEEIESLIGVAGNLSDIPAHPTLAHAPRTRHLPMPAGPGELTSLKVADGARAMGLHPFPAMMAANTRPHNGRPACNNCGFCSSYGCPILARVGALAPLTDAIRHGADLKPESLVTRLNWKNRRATGVTWVDRFGRSHTQSADAVVVSAMAIETVRLALLSELPDPHDVAGRYLMFHWFSAGTGIFLREKLHTYRGRSTSHVVDDFADPDYPGARAAARAAGLPYFRGGTIEIGGSQPPISEAQTYQGLLKLLAPSKPFGTDFKALMRASLLRDRLAGANFIGEDLPYPDNRVDLSPSVRDWRGVPVPRITYGPGVHEQAAQAFYLPLLAEMMKRSGADVSVAVPRMPSARFPIASGTVPDTDHVLGGMRMGEDPTTSVTDGVGRHHHIDNLFVADGSLFPTSGGHNPTLTIMATVLRNTRQWA